MFTRKLHPHHYLLSSALLLAGGGSACMSEELMDDPASRIEEHSERLTGAATASITGYLAPDVSGASASVLAGFDVTVVNAAPAVKVKTDDKGFFRVEGLTPGTTPYELRIERRGYLTRSIKGLTLTGQGNLRVGSPTKPELIWPGDIPATGGAADGAINMSDIMTCAGAFNTSPSTPNFRADCDINGDGAVNMADIIGISKHFNTSAASYPAAVVTPEANWTYIVYLNGDNSLNDDAIADLAEMKQIGSSANANVVVMLDTQESNAPYGGQTVRLLVNKNAEPTVLQNMGELDMGNWQNLADFGSWAVNAYPASNYALILWNHGGGWRTSPKSPLFKEFSSDDTSGSDGISVANGDYARALAQITGTIKRKIDLVGFDACLMGMVEVATATVPYGKYLVASEESEPGSGWAYDQLLGSIVNANGTSAQTLGIATIDSYRATGGPTLSLLQLDKIPQLGSALSLLADSMRADPTQFPAIEDARSAATSMDFVNNKDLGTFLDGIDNASMSSGIRAAIPAVKTALNNAVLYARASTAYAATKGLAIWFPPQAPRYADDVALYNSAVWSQQGTWDDFLNAFCQ